MQGLENLVRLFATIVGVVVLAVPILMVLSQHRRPRGQSSGVAAGSRRWLGILLITLVLVSLGFLLWKPLPLSLSGVLRMLFTGAGALLYFAGTGLYLWGLATLRSQFGVSSLFGADLYRDHRLITGGPFAIIRHPMYAGVLLAALGALLIFRTWAMVLFAPASLVVISRARREEKLLEGAFGETWKTYAARVPGWFPKLFSCRREREKRV